MSSKRSTRTRGARDDVASPSGGTHDSSPAPPSQAATTSSSQQHAGGEAESGTADVDLRRVEWLRYDEVAGLALLRKTGASKQNSLSLLRWSSDEFHALKSDVLEFQRKANAFLASTRGITSLDDPDSVGAGRLRICFPQRVGASAAAAAAGDSNAPATASNVVAAAAAAAAASSMMHSSTGAAPVTPGTDGLDLDESRGRSNPSSSRGVRNRGTSTAPRSQSQSTQALRKRRRSEDPANAADAADTAADTTATAASTTAREPKTEPKGEPIDAETSAQGGDVVSTRGAAAAETDGDAVVPLVNAVGAPLDDDGKDGSMRKRSAALPNVRQQYLQRDREVGDGTRPPRKRRNAGEGGDDEETSLAVVPVVSGNVAAAATASTAAGAAAVSSAAIGATVSGLEEQTIVALMPYAMRDADLVRPLPANVSPSSFWQSIEPFFAPLTQEFADAMLSTKPAPGEEQHFAMPPLAVSMSQASIAAIKSRSHRPETTEAEMHAEAAAIEYWSTDACQPGELTQRLLATLFDEQELDETRAAQLRLAEAQMNNAAIAAASAMGDKNDMAPVHPLAAPPVANYSLEAMLQLDARVRESLRNIGLMDEAADPPLHLREDDDLCAEIRVAQRMLRERIKTNASRKAQIAKLVAPKIEQERRHQWDRQQDRATETYLVAKVKAAAKRKKKPLVKKPRA